MVVTLYELLDCLCVLIMPMNASVRYLCPHYVITLSLFDILKCYQYVGLEKLSLIKGVSHCWRFCMPLLIVVDC